MPSEEPTVPYIPTILLVDDDSNTRLLLKRWLQRESYTLYEAEDGLQALEVVNNVHPAIVLLDVMMPGLNGFDTCAELQKVDPAERPLVVMMTALEDPDSVDKAFKAGATDYITKPIHWEILRQRMRRLIETKLAHEALRAEIEEHKRSEVALRSSEEKLAQERNLLYTLISNIPDFIYVKDTACRYVTVNAATMLHLGVSHVEDAIGKTDFDFHSADLATQYYVNEQTIIQSGQPLLNWEEPGLDWSTGESIWLLSSKIPLKDSQGKITGLVGIDRNITERKKIERKLDEYHGHLENLVDERTRELTDANSALYKSEEQLRRLTDNMLDMVCETNEQGYIEYVTPSCWSVLGYAPEDMIGQSMFTWIHPDDVDQVIVAVQNVGRLEYRCLHADGKYIWLETLSNFLLDDNFATKGIIFASRDITKRKEAEKELQELNRLKTEFLSTAAHELRTPLTSIRGFTEILLTRQIDDARKTRYMGLINEQATQLGAIIDDLLDISRLEAKRNLTLSMECVDMREVINKVMMPFVETAPKHHIVVEGFENCPSLSGDPFRLAQVCKNLLSNAVKYSPEGGTIMINCRFNENYVEISVRDQGIGMTAEQLAHLFEKFYRADASNLTISGTGLGLAISKLLVELHGGQIWAESDYGVGTTFFFTLPITQDEKITE